MIKLVFCLRRLPGLSREEFQRYWREQHPPLVRAAAPALRIENMGGLEGPPKPPVSFGAPRRSRGAPRLDGVAELWWESAEDLAAAGVTPEGRDAGRRLLEDERRFIDLARSTLTLGAEHVVVDR